MGSIKYQIEEIQDHEPFHKNCMNLESNLVENRGKIKKIRRGQLKTNFKISKINDQI